MIYCTLKFLIHRIRSKESLEVEKVVAYFRNFMVLKVVFRNVLLFALSQIKPLTYAKNAALFLVDNSDNKLK